MNAVSKAAAAEGLKSLTKFDGFAKSADNRKVSE